MRLPSLLFGWVLASAALFTGLAIAGADAGPQLAPHETFATLLIGGDGAARMAPVFAWGAAIGFVQVGLLATAFALGFGPTGRARLGRGAVFAAAALHAAAFAALLWATHHFVAGDAAWLGPFPAPTSILVFVLWPAPLVYLALFLRHFDAWLPSPEAEARLNALRSRASSSEAPPA